MNKLAQNALWVIMLLLFLTGLGIAEGLHLAETGHTRAHQLRELNPRQGTINSISEVAWGTIFYLKEFPNQKFIHLAFVSGDVHLKQTPLKEGDFVQLYIPMGDDYHLDYFPRDTGTTLVYGLTLATGTTIYDPGKELVRYETFLRRIMFIVGSMIAVPLIYFTAVIRWKIYKRTQRE